MAGRERVRRWTGRWGNGYVVWVGGTGGCCTRVFCGNHARWNLKDCLPKLAKALKRAGLVMLVRWLPSDRDLPALRLSGSLLYCI